MRVVPLASSARCSLHVSACVCRTIIEVAHPGRVVLTEERHATRREGSGGEEERRRRERRSGECGGSWTADWLLLLQEDLRWPVPEPIRPKSLQRWSNETKAKQSAVRQKSEAKSKASAGQYGCHWVGKRAPGPREVLRSDKLGGLSVNAILKGLKRLQPDF